MAERFHQVLGGLKGQKHLENGLSATFCTHKNQSWEIEVLEGKMTSKSRNSTWVGKYTGRDLQRAIMSSIWTLVSAPKIGSKWRDVLSFWARRIEKFGLVLTLQLRNSPSFY